MKETNTNRVWKKFRRYKDGADYYGISQKKFEKLAKDADAIYKIDRTVLVNCEILEEFLEGYKIKSSEYYL